MRSVAESFPAPPLGNEPPHPPEKRRAVAPLVFDIDRLVVILRIDNRREVKLLRIGLGKAAVAIGRPLHGSAHSIAIAKIEIVPHPDFIAVVNDRRARAGKRAGR